ncbi:MAG: hypothetical protein IT167_13325 [Bryobacterales bacterium]|nr:hypothetical protein [Bryobacterales bacterium]
MSDLEKKQQIARENGKKSKGPITPEGKKRSSLNSITHGLASKCVVLATESQDAYDDLAAKYQHEWQPVSVTESHLLTQMVNSCWRLRRIWALETALIDSETFIEKAAFEAAWTSHHPAMRTMDSVASILIENPMAIETLQRYETRYDRLYRSSMDQLIKLRRLRHAPEIAPALPAPEPHPETVPEAASEHVEPLPQPAAPANWLTRLLAMLFSFLAVFLTKTPKSRKSAQNRTSKSSKPISLAEASFWTFEFPEFFSWLTSFIPKTAASAPEMPPQSE